MSHPRILVTGGSGLVGSCLLRKLRQKGYTQLTATFQNPDAIPADLKQGITWKPLKLPDIPDAFEVIDGQDIVIHAAALISYHPEDKFRLLDINKTGTEIIVNACLEHHVQHLIYIGSIGALGKESNHAKLNESNVWLPNKYSTPYGLSKYLGELEVWRGAGEGLNVSVILPSVILGTGDWFRSSLQLIDRVANHAPWYPGGQTGYVDVRDIAAFIVLLLEKGNVGGRWLLNGANVRYKDMYMMIAKELELNRKFREAPKWLARVILFASNLKSGRLSVPDIIDQVYGNFSYDACRSLTLGDFRYTPIEKTIKDVAAAYKLKGGSVPLEFD